MKSGVSESKRILRQQLRETLRTLSAAQREEAAAKACILLQQQRSWKTAKSVLFYAPLPNELNIWALVPEALAAGKAVLLPRFNETQGAYETFQIQDLDTDLAPGKFGILEPLTVNSSFPLNRLDLSLVPGLGFDPLGGRLGRGGGFYDRLLAQVSGMKCGVAFDRQIVPLVPVEPHDVRVNCILTPTRWLPAGAVAE
jgi:5-formyltetrahydrofolate cyclo-ligase